MKTRSHRRLMESIQKASAKPRCACDGGAPCLYCQAKNRAHFNAAHARFIEAKGTNPENY